MKVFGAAASATVIGITINAHGTPKPTPHRMTRIVQFAPMTEVRRQGTLTTRRLGGTRGILFGLGWLTIAAAAPATSMNATPGMTFFIELAPMTTVGIGTIRAIGE